MCRLKLFRPLLSMAVESFPNCILFQFFSFFLKFHFCFETGASNLDTIGNNGGSQKLQQKKILNLKLKIHTHRILNSQIYNYLKIVEYYLKNFNLRQPFTNNDLCNEKDFRYRESDPATWVRARYPNH